MQHHVDIASYCYAGSQASLLRALFEDRRRPLFGQAREVTLAPLAADAIGGWVLERFHAGGRTLTEGSAAALAGGAAGHPQRAAMVAHFLWRQARNVLEAEGHLRREGNRFALVDPFLGRWLRA